jgi:hypothetical protein
MTNLSTLLKNGNLAEEIKMMEEMDTDFLVLAAPETAVRNILGFASSFEAITSILLDEIEVYKN